MSATRPEEAARGIVTADAMVFFNIVALYLVTGHLIAAFVFEFTRDELPCPLCLLQRIALSGMAAGLILNQRVTGSSPVTPTNKINELYAFASSRVTL